jgi:50S ribosomal protein L16 3-hydroxylase
MTCSIGFRAPSAAGLAQEVLQRVLEDIDVDDPALYRDPSQPATAGPGRVPEALQAFARSAVERALRAPAALERALGEVMTEPKPSVWFDAGAPLRRGQGVRLDRRTRMMYDASHVYINGEAFRAGGRDATLMRRLADARGLTAVDVGRLGDDARALLSEWLQAGWLHGE